MIMPHRTPHAAKARMQPSFRAAVQSGVLELVIYEDIGEDFWTGGGVTGKLIRQKIDAAGAFNTVSVRINSPGGDAFEGITIYNLLRALKKPIDVHIDGIAASAASIIAMAGDTITMGPNTMQMVHNAWTICIGDGDDMRQCGQTLDKVSQSVGQTYVARTGKTEAEIKVIMDAETWMGAQECVDQGFATAIAAEPQEDEGLTMAASFRQLSRFKQVPEQLKARTPKADVDDGCDCPCAPCQDGNCTDCSCDGCDSEACTSASCDCGEAVAASSNLSQYEARLTLLRAS